MNGLTATELATLARLRTLAESDLPQAKQEASSWVRANRRRRLIRRAATRTVRGLYA